MDQSNALNKTILLRLDFLFVVCNSNGCIVHYTAYKYKQMILIK